MAKKFTFRLESILRIRTHIAELAKEELNKVLAYKYEKESMVLEYKMKISQINQLKSKNIQDIQVNYQYKLFLDEEIKKLQGEILRLEEIEQIKRDELSAAMKDQKVIEKLKERKKEQYNHEMNQLDAIFFDELALNRFDKVESYFK